MAANPEAPRPHSRYPVLKKLAGVLRALAWFSLILSVVTVAITIVAAVYTSDLKLAAAGLAGAVYGAFLFIYLLVTGETIELALDIEDNTRRTADSLGQLRNAGGKRGDGEGRARAMFE